MPKLVRPLLLSALLIVALGVAWHLLRPAPTPVSPALRHSYSKALDLAHNGKPGAARVLYQQLARTDLSPVRRISLLAELPNYPSPQALKLVTADLKDDQNLLVRHGAIDAVSRLVPDAQRSLLLGPLLDDDDQDIRFHVARSLLGLSPDDLGLYFARLNAVLDDYVQALISAPDDADGQLELAKIYLYNDDYTQALATLKRAHERVPGDLETVAVQVRVLEKQGQNDASRQLLAEQLVAHPDSALLQHELGQWLIRHGQGEYALLALARASELEPDNSDYRYSLAVTLHQMDQVEAAQRQLDEILRRQPADRKARVLLIEYWKQTGQLQNVQVLLAELEQQNPDDPALQQGL
ncbi:MULTISPECIES: tetratricopeptide repeat protein [Pseudomonas]|uniref:Tetratricopeptide repeat protein n=1 Tax=Pseudomonas eucalypticola TaxID=2599595 RepID=A0A7D5D7Y0_9PSED|nr:MULTISPECIES: tetratricopeptide repeat protein [Pseudomonas]QKZ05078.1 tetratricopeptide repeat protein [Pseudomonas eucalypticola]